MCDKMNPRNLGLSGVAFLTCLICLMSVFSCGGAFAQTKHTPPDWDAFQTLTINPGDTVQFSATTHKVDGQMELVSNVTYQGAPGGDGGVESRAFTAWGDRSLNDGKRDFSENITGPKG